MKSVTARKKKRLWLFLLPPFFLVSVASAAIYHTKDNLIIAFSRAFHESVRDSLGLRVEVGRLGGNVFGGFTFKGLRVYSEGPEGERELLFEAEEARFRYRLADFFLEHFGEAPRIVLQKPVFYADVPFSIDRARAAGSGRDFEIFSKVVSRVKNRAKLLIRDGRVVWRGAEEAVSGLSGVIEDQEFDLVLSVNHVRFGISDISTQLFIRGRLQEGEDGSQTLVGFMKTRGTVVNWKPIAAESRLIFALSEERFTIRNSSFGGIEAKGAIGLRTGKSALLTLKSRSFLLEQLNDFFVLPPEHQLSGFCDMALELSGDLRAPAVKGSVTIKDSQMGGRPFKNMQLSVEGVYPEVRLSESRVVMPDGTAMSFANQTVRVEELLDAKTYRQLIARAEQSDVMWDDWRLTRPEGDSMVVERGFGDAMKLKYERADHNEQVYESDEKSDEVELEYRLTDGESLKMEVRDEEHVVGIQKKVSF